MRNKKLDYILLAIITATLLVAVLISVKIKQMNDKFFYICFNVENKEYIIDPYFQEEENTYYFFLPSHYDKSNTTMKVNKSIVVDGLNIKDGQINISDVLINKEYSIKSNNNDYGKLVFLHGSNIPAIYINTKSKSIDFLEANKENSDSGQIVIINDDGSVECSDKLEKISGRGNATWETCNNKPWSLKLNSAHSLFGMKESSNWILLANSFDESDGLRNFIAYTMSNEIGMNTGSELRFVDLYINNDYRGLYQICERIEYDDEKLNIGDLDALNNEANKCILDIDKLTHSQLVDKDESLIKKWTNIESPDNITGGYILERNYDDKLYDKEHVFVTEGDEGFVVRYPEIVSKEEIDYISDIFQSIENALFSDDYIDSKSGKELSELIDVESWVLKYLVDEITKNEGAGTTSSYFYKKQNDKLIYGGPVWDYDKSLGNYRIWKDPNELTYSSWHEFSPTLWYERLYNYPKANELIKEFYKNRARPYLDKLISEILDEKADLISDSYYMDSIRWKWQATYEYLEEYIYDEKKHGKIEYPTNYLKDWIMKREQFLDSIWLEEGSVDSD